MTILRARRATRLLTLLVALFLVAAACDNGDDAAGDADLTTTSGGDATSTSVADAADQCTPSEPQTGLDVEPVSGEPEGGPLFVESVAHAARADDCVEEVTFQLEDVEGGSPGYDVRYDSPPFEDISGEAKPVDGGAFIRLTLSNVSTVDLATETPRETLDSIDEAADGAVVRDIELISDFEAVTDWVVGLDIERPFTVEFDATTSRLVVTISTS